MEVSNDGSLEPPKLASPETPEPVLPELELSSSSTGSPSPEPPRPISPEPELTSSSTSSAPPEPPRPVSPETPEPAPPPPELASSSTIHYTLEIEEEEDRTDVSSQNNQVISSAAPLLSQPYTEVWYRYSIFMVPSNLRKMEEKAYTPQFISIGPVHRHQSHLQLMEAHKRRFLQRSLDRTGQDLEVYLKAIWPFVDKTRECYAVSTRPMEDQDFVMMMLLDSCFILELLMAVAQGINHNRNHKDEPLFASRAVILRIRKDMLLLENQIPLFVLECLFPLIAGSDFERYSVSQLALFFFSWTVPGSLTKQETCNTGNDHNKGLHFLDVIRKSLIPLQSTPPPSSSSSLSQQPHLIDIYEHQHLMLRCVSTLVDCGVKFEKRTSSRLTDIKFEMKGGVLKIPPLTVDDSTKSVFLNLMAFEQCYSHCSDQISAYVVFMDGLINTPRDVSYLEQKGIINHQLGSEKAVAKLFNDLCREISIDYMDGSDIFFLCSELNKHCSRMCSPWKASLRREYFRHPWSTISVLAAVLIIVFTLTQTLYAILAYHVYHS